MWMVPLKSFAEHGRVKIKVVMKALLPKTFPLSINCFKSIWKCTALKKTDLHDPSTKQEVLKKQPCTSTCTKIICRTLRISPCMHRSTNTKRAITISKKEKNTVTCIVSRKNASTRPNTYTPVDSISLQNPSSLTYISEKKTEHFPGSFVMIMKPYLCK